MRWTMLLVALLLTGCTGRQHLKDAQHERDDVRAQSESIKEDIKSLPEMMAQQERLEKEAAALRARRDQLKRARPK